MSGKRAEKVKKKEPDVRKGNIRLMKLKIITDNQYNVCSDTITKFDEEDKLFLYKQEGDYYHWLMVMEPENADKRVSVGGILPITLHSNQEFELEGTFIPIYGDVDKVTITVNQNDLIHNDRFHFEKVTKSGLSKGKEFKAKFKVTNTPFKDTMQYIERYHFKFEYSDNQGFEQRVTFRLYITWKAPEWAMYDSIKSNNSGQTFPGTNDEKKSLRVLHDGKKYILESLLYVSCRTTNNQLEEQQVVDKIFDKIQSLNILRPRDITYEPLGYWRCSSALNPDAFLPIRSEPFNRTTRSVRFMLRIGDGRCGEWTCFFAELCRTQGITGVTQLSFEMETMDYIADNDYKSTIFLVNGWDIDDPKCPVDEGGRAQGNFRPLNFFADHVFSVYKGVFYDASYGVKGVQKHSSIPSLFSEYWPVAIQGIPFVKIPSSSDLTGGESFFDRIHSYYYIDPQTFDYFEEEDAAPKFIYKTINKDYEKYISY